MHPFSQGTKNLQRVYDVALQAAVELMGTNYIGSEHILYAFLQIPECDAYGILTQAGVDVDDYTRAFRSLKPSKGLKDGLTDNMRRMYDSALLAAQRDGVPVGTPHLLAEILANTTCYATRYLCRIGGGENMGKQREFLEWLEDRTESAIHTLINKQMMGGDIPLAEDTSSAEAIVKRIEMQRSAEQEKAVREQEVKLHEEGTGKSKRRSSKLPDCGLDMTERARRGKMDPVIGRKKEIEKVVQVLSRRLKNNPVLIGEPGVGKSAIVEGLSQLIVTGNVPEQLLNKTVFSVDLPGMLAGTRYRGDFEEKLKNLIDMVLEDGDVILFIDEIHSLVGAGGSTDNNMDAANILKPLLARGDLQVVGATTIEEYRKYIEKDSALERRFTPVYVEEPSEADTIAILKGLRPKYEEHHGIVITDEAVEAAVKLSTRYITDRFLPDKAIDLIDEAAAHVRISEENGSVELQEAKEEADAYERERASAEARGDYALASEALKGAQRALEKYRALQQAQAPLQLPMGRIGIGKEHVAAIVSARMRIPLLKMSQAEGEKLMRLEEDLHARIIGQNEGVSAVAKAIRRARAGLKDPSRPIGSFIFVGPTGVGKTDLCKALAETMFGSEEQIIRLDMSEYMEKQSVSKIIGAPPGYVGYEDLQSGQLTEKVRTKPYCVILFDEIEKAHPDVFNLLLQMLDDGRLTDSKGRTVSFKNAIIILTSNVGVSASESQRTGVYGFGSENRSGDGASQKEYESMKENVTKALKEKFRPEFLNRLDDIIVFHRLSESDCVKIGGKIVNGLAKRVMEQRGIALSMTERALYALVKSCYDVDYGARPLKREIQKRIEDRLSEEILLGKIKNGQSVTVEYREGEFIFSVKE